MRNKPVSEIRKYRQFRAQVRLTMLSVIPATIIPLLFLGKSVFGALISAWFIYFIATIVGGVLLNNKYTNEQAILFSRFDVRWGLRSFFRELFALLVVFIITTLLLSIFKLDLFTCLMPIFMLSVMILIFAPSVCDPNTKLGGNGENAIEEYKFSPFQPMDHSYNYLSDPVHPGSYLNPNNPISPLHRD